MFLSSCCTAASVSFSFFTLQRVEHVHKYRRDPARGVLRYGRRSCVWFTQTFKVQISVIFYYLMGFFGLFLEKTILRYLIQELSGHHGNYA